MKMILIALLLGGFELSPLLAAPSTPILRLAGIVRLPDRRVAIIESIPARIGNARQLILSEGQRDGDLEVLQIDTEKGTANLRTGRTNVVLHFNLANQTNPPGSAGFAILLDNADLDPVLRIYSEFKNRTLLRSPRLPATSFSCNDSSTNPVQTVLMLERMFARKGIAIIPDGEKFLMVVPESEAAAVKPHASEIKATATPGDNSTVYPSGAIKFAPATLQDVAQIYAGFIGRKLESDPRSTVPDGRIKFQNHTPLSKAECVYALDTLLRWQGVKVIPVADALARLVPISKPESGPHK